MNKKILITGANSDVGIALIKLLLSRGEKVIGTYNSSPGELESLNSSSLFLYQCNLSHEDEIQNLIKKVALDHGVPDGIVHLAAPAVSQIRYQKISWDTFQEDLNIQLKSIHLVLKSFLPQMADRGSGKVVFMLSSYTINTPPSAMVHYTTVKFAMLGFMRSLASEFRTKGININSVSPSMIKTKFLKNIPSISVEMAEQGHPLKRIAIPEDVAPTMAFLLSDEARFIHGVNLPVTGGEVF